MSEETIITVIDALTYGATLQNSPAAPGSRAAYEHFYQLLLSYSSQYNGFAEILLDFLQEPTDWRGPLKKALSTLRIDNNRALISAAEQLLAIKPQNSVSKFLINNSGHINQQNIGDNHQNSSSREEGPPKAKH